MTTVDQLQQRAHAMAERDPAALMAWEPVHTYGLRPDAPRDWPRPLRLGELRYVRRAPDGELRLPATFGHTDATRHLLVARAPAEAGRAAALLNAVALRYLLGTAPSRRLLLASEYHDRRDLSPAVAELRGRATVFPPDNVAHWIDAREQAEEPALAVVFAAHRRDDAPDDEMHTFSDGALAALLDHMRRPGRPHVRVALSFDPTDAEHPVRRAFDAAAFPAARVRLAAAGDGAGDAVLGTERASLAGFTPDVCPADDFARDLLRAAAGAAAG